MINVCVTVLNRYDMLRKLLLSLRESTVTPDGIYVINSGLNQSAIDEAIEDTIEGKVIILRPNRPLGVAESWNWFIQNVPEDRLIVNDDIEFAPESLARMMEAKAAFVSCSFGFSCFIIRDACVDKVGLFDETISPGYGYFEDMDYLRRMHLAGVEDDVVRCDVVHHQSQTPKAFSQERLVTHNRRFLLAQNNYTKKWASNPSWEQLTAMGGAGEHHSISFIVPTIGRMSLVETLRSIETWPGDEILVVGNTEWTGDVRPRYIPCAPGGDWGHTERNFATPMAKGQYIAHIDDDDTYAPGTRRLMHDAATKTPGRPALFRMRYPNGITLWQDQAIRCGNVGTPMMLIPNVPEKLGTWKPYVGGDCAFLEGCKWQPEEFVWRPEVIALLGHNV